MGLVKKFVRGYHICMALLFEDFEKIGDDDLTPAANGDGGNIGGCVVAVAINANVWGEYSYIFPAGLGQAFTGQRVKVPFGRGNRETLGFVTKIAPPITARKLKPITSVVDTHQQFDAGMLELARWISSYYLTPPGMTLAGMIPSAIGQFAPKHQTVVFLNRPKQDWPRSLGLRQSKILDELLEAKKQGVEPLPLEALVRHSGGGRDTIRRLLKRELIRTELREVEIEDHSVGPDGVVADPFGLNADQKNVLASLESKLLDENGAFGKRFSATLLHGVTGSGKTEIYVRAIRKVVDAGKQAILLSPEIALATQTLQRLLNRLPRVAVLHSGLAPSQRAFYWSQIRDGRASVVVGPRSAIFAPIKTERLGLIIVDEEHESSYKQDTAPRYHGRDVAVKRAAISNVPIILGSATPSMESLQNVRAGKYFIEKLPSRVRNLPLPKLEIVHLRREMTRGTVELLGATLTRKIAATLDRSQQVILLMNRRGYASYVFCPSCKWMMECENCIRPMVYHQALQMVICHHCDKRTLVPEACPACKKKILLFGYGIQRIEDELARKFPVARVARMDSDTMTSPKQFQKVLGEFAEGKIDILLGTQMVAKGLDFPNVSLVGIVSADTSLLVHDFRASERTFQLIVQVAGRAGRGDTPGEVVVQTLHADDPAVIFAEHHDYDKFAEYELSDRRESNFPPFSRMIRFIVRHEKSEVAESGAEKLATTLKQTLPREGVKIFAAAPAEFIKIRNMFRFSILMISDKPGVVQHVLGPQMASIVRNIHAEILIDVDPMNLL